ncbi:protein kinase [bacterium]|nr:protein kinase [candidate division CSSED10-310 bacterium]
MKQTAKTARKLFKEGNYAAAAALFEKAEEWEKALEAYERSGDWLEAGKIAISLGRGEQAVQLYLKARRYDILGEYFEARKNHLESARYYSRAGKHTKSAQMYEIILRSYPELKEIPGESPKRSDEEIKVARLAASAHSKAENYRRAAELHHKLGQYDDEARNHLMSREYFAAGEAYTRAGLLADAGESFAAGGFYREAGESYEKERSYRLAAENYQLAGLYERSGKAFELAGEFFKAADVYADGDLPDHAIKALTGIPPDHEHYLKSIQKLLVLCEQKRYITPPARRILEGFLETEFRQKHLNIYYKIAVLMEKSEYPEVAEVIYERIGDFDPDLLEVLRNRHEMELDDGSTSEDIENIMDVDFDAETREKSYSERRERLQTARERLETTTGVLNLKPEPKVDPDATPSKPASFMRIEEGQRFGDRYQILTMLGSGGMGTVYMAKDLELDECVAIKILSPQFSAEGTVVARFKQEIKLARQINHPNVIRIHDLGEFYGIKFITMEYFHGEQVKRLIADNGFFPVAPGLQLVLNVCAGLDAAHKKGIIHRDIKSQNIMISKEGIVKVLDFGIAKSAEIAGLTTDGSILGTPEYISPEAIMQKPVDARSDIYSLGIVMFEIFTGMVPFTGENVIGIIRQHLYEDPPNPCSINARIPVELERVILRCMQRNPEDRYQTVEELSADLQALDAVFGNQDVNLGDTLTFGDDVVSDNTKERN